MINQSNNYSTYTLKNPIDGHNIPVFYYQSEHRKATSIPIIQIVHGMCEHHEYYDDFIKYFNNLGYDIYIHDHRGHGATVVDNKDLGFIDEHNGHQKLIADCQIVTQDIHNKNNCPIMLIGNSMGALVALVTSINHPQDQYIKKLILIGSPGLAPLWQLVAGSLSIKFEILRKNQHYLTPVGKAFLELFNNRSFLREKNKFAWITSDLEWSKKIEQDPKAGFVPQSQFWLDLLALLKFSKDQKNLNKLDKNLPVYFFDGADDVINNYTKQTKKLVAKLKNLGCKNITHKIYPNTRHNLFLEKNREIFFADLAEVI